MRNSHKNGLLKSLTTIILVVLACALTLTGCSDKTARELANQALTAAQNAQNAADKAQTSAGNAQDKADNAQNSADSNKNVIDSLPDSEAVAAVVQDILNKYVKGAALTEDSIITIAELETFLASDEVATLLAQYVTIEALADYAKASDVTALTAQFEAALAQVTTALGTYVTKEAYELDKTSLTGAITELTTNLNNAISALATKESVAEIKTALGDYLKTSDALKALEGYCTKDDAAKLQNKFAEYYTKGEVDKLVDEIVGDIDFTTLESDLEAYADAAVLDAQVQFEEATKVVIEAIEDINGMLTAFAKIKDTFDAEEYDKMVAKYESAKLELLRAQRAETLYDENGNVVIKGVDLILAEVEEFLKNNVNNLAAQLYNAIQNVQTLIVPVAHITDTYKSQEQIDACKEIIEQAEGQLGADSDAYKALMTMEINGEKVFLPALVDELQADYDNLVAAKSAAEFSFSVIISIPAYADLKVDMVEAREFFAKRVGQSTLNYTNWVEKFFANDAENVNIERIFSAPMSAEENAPTYAAYYNGAVEKLAALVTLDKEASLLNREIFETLEAAKPVLYTDYETFKTLNDKVAAWVETNGVENVPVVLPYAPFMYPAYSYATRMYTAYENATDLIKALEEALALDLVLASEEQINAAYVACNAWVNKYSVDADNVKAILGDKAENIKAASERMVVLNNAKTAVGAINDKIAALVADNKFNGNINSMAAIRELRNEIVTWLNTYNVVPATNEASAIADWIANANADKADVVLNVTGTYYADNYNMLKHADLDFAIGEFNKIVSDAIAYAKTNVIPKMQLVDAKDAKILYQFKNIMNALNAYYVWVVEYNVFDPDIRSLDFGESDFAAEAEGVLVGEYVTLMSVYGEYLEVAKAASDMYAADRATYEAFAEAIKSLDTITVKDGAIINAAYKLAAAWKAKFLDDSREGGAWNDAILAIIEDVKSEDILTAEIYNSIEKAYYTYEKLVSAARTEGEKLVESNATVEVTVYNGAAIAALQKAFEDWMTKYGIVLADFEGNELDETLKFVKYDFADVVANKQAEYNTLVANAAAAFETIKTKVEALNAEQFSIYYAEVIKPIRAEYDAWVKAYGLTSNKADAYTETLAAELAGFKATLEALEAAEAALKVIEDAKKAETETVKGIIDALTAADKVTTADREAIEAARAAYTKWFNGDNNVLKAIDATKDNAAYGYDLTASLATLEAAEAALAALDAALESTFDAIDAANALVNAALTKKPVDADYAEVMAAAEKAIEDAYKAIEEFYNKNGNANNGAITEETMTALADLANSKMALAAHKIINTLDPVADAAAISKIRAAQTSGVSQIKNVTLENYEEYFAKEDKASVDYFAAIATNVANGYAHLVG